MDHQDENGERREAGGGGRDSSLGVERAGREGGGSGSDDAMSLAIEAARMLDDDKCEDVLVLDLRGHSQVTDFFVIGSGTSERQMRSAGMHVEEMGEGMGFALHRSNLKDREAKWLVLDFVDVIVHLFEPETRLFYDLEMLWGDVERMEWRRPGDGDRNRAGLRGDDVLPGSSG